MREEARFDAAEDDRAIAEELSARFGKAAGQLVRGIDVEPKELVPRRPLERDDLQIRIGGNRGADEAHLVARLAFDVEDFLTSVAHVDQRLLRVVLFDLL